MANPAVGSAVKFERVDGFKFNALVLADQGAGFVDIVYVDTTQVPVAILTVSSVPVVTPSGAGVVIA